MRKPLLTLLAAASLLAGPLVAPPAMGQTGSSSRIDEVISSLRRGYHIGQVAISPDGKRLAWIEGSRSGGILHVAELDQMDRRGAAAAGTVGGPCSANFPLWTPDSAKVIFVSDCGAANGQMDFYIQSEPGQAPRRISALEGSVDDPAMAPDGRSIAFLYVPDATRPAGALAAMKAPSGVIGEDGVEVQRLAVVPVGSGPAAPKMVSPENLHVYEFDWAPDSRAVAYTAAEPPGENNWWVAKLYTQTLKAPPKVLLDPATVSGSLHGLQMAVPRWSPDGQQIAFIGGLMSDQGVTGGDLWLVSASGGQPQNLTPGRPSTVEWFTWDDNRSLYLNELAGGDVRLTRLFFPQMEHTAPGAPLQPAFDAPVFHLPITTDASGLEMSLSATRDRSLFVFRASSNDTPPEILGARAKLPESVHSADVSRIEQLTEFNQDQKPVWGKSDSVEWSNDGFQVQGWLILPRDYSPKKKYPMIVEVHGGPAYAETSRWGGSFALSPAAFSAMGYFVFLPNPRGSFGQGEAFTQANRKDFGYGDLRDILAGVDAVVAKYRVDPNRVGVTGWSYGGFMTMFAVTQTGRFRAAVAGAGISNWLSYYGENSIDQWMIPFFGASVYDDPEVYAKSSAINYIQKVKTPTLVVVGDRDGECPAPQSFEFWHGLRDHHVPTQLVVYPNEGHGFSNPAHSRDVLERAIGWFDRYMPEGKQAF
jgi:dipeptidyl aminopeptidase/acylaminoacyl peptidase